MEQIIKQAEKLPDVLGVKRHDDGHEVFVGLHRFAGSFVIRQVVVRHSRPSQHTVYLFHRIPQKRTYNQKWPEYRTRMQFANFSTVLPPSLIVRVTSYK
ncbi:MAG: hypothetical protein ACI8PB_004269 [Desulforhopalus sp.]